MARLSAVSHYLFYWQDPQRKDHVKLLHSLEAVVGKWSATARMSPIFPIVLDSGPHSEQVSQFRPESYLIFLGPFHPQELLKILPRHCRVFLTFGAYNLLVECLANGYSELHKTLRKLAVPHEVWQLKADRIVLIKPHEEKDLRADATPMLQEIASLLQTNWPAELQEALNEYCPLMASTYVRSSVLPNCISQELVKIHHAVCELLRDGHPHASTEQLFSTLGQLLTLNAGLSRFSSQTFAGISPILKTECHFWTHSLLGIGIVNLGLRNVRFFVHEKLGRARIPEKFVQLQDTTKFPMIESATPAAKDYLSRANVNEDSCEELVPLLTYMSGRDGYRSSTLTMSAPLAAVGACNNRRWSLLTLTHELSHVVIRQVLSDLYPDIYDEAAMTECYRLLEDPERAKSKLEQVRHLLMMAMLSIDEPHTDEHVIEDIENLRDVLRNRWHDLDETMVHVFDFLYFYGSDVGKYTAGIWASWGTIPNVRSRVRDYTIRTVSAVLTRYLRRGYEAESMAREDVLKELRRTKKNGLGGHYVSEAIRLLEHAWEDDIENEVRARRPIVSIVLEYLFSTEIATSLRSETRIAGGAGKKGGYTFKPGEIVGWDITNPLKFVEEYVSSETPSSSVSLWMFQVLAFGDLK